MLSVKHINDLNGEEKIWSAFTVEFRPKDHARSDPIDDRVLLFTEDHYVIAEIDHGTVFVMNEQGKTVTRYNLNAG